MICHEILVALPKDIILYFILKDEEKYEIQNKNKEWRNKK